MKSSERKNRIGADCFAPSRCADLATVACALTYEMEPNVGEDDTMSIDDV